MKITIQNLFRHECQNYAYYINEQEKLNERYIRCQSKLKELEEITEANGRIVEFISYIKSTAFQKRKEKLNLPLQFERIFEGYKEQDFTEEIEKVKDAIDIIDFFATIVDKKIKDCRTCLFEYISLASEKKEIFSFSNEEKKFERIFIAYYANGTHFQENRDVIDIKHCPFTEEFVRNYTAPTHDAEALRWFCKKAQQNNFY